MASAADDYLEKLAVVRDADKKTSQAVTDLIQAVREFGSEGENWGAMALPETRNLPIIKAMRLPKQAFPTWQTPQEIKSYIIAYHEALAAALQAYNALSPVQKAGVHPPPSKQD